jgi:arylsulfatase A-like enzyme
MRSTSSILLPLLNLGDGALVTFGDDIGWFNIGAYHRGIMAGRTPNIDKLASEGALMTDS